MTVWAYYRVSTDNQDYNSQKIGVVDYCSRNGLKIDREIIDEGVSGKVIAEKRNLRVILKNMRKGDYIITSELSRLGRSTVDVLRTCKKISDSGVNCWFVKQGMGIDDTPMGKMMIAIFSAFSEMERDLISQRTKEGLARVKASGRQLGHKVGTKFVTRTTKLLDANTDLLKEWLGRGYSYTWIAKKIKVSLPTFLKWRKNKGLETGNRFDIYRCKEVEQERRMRAKLLKKVD